MRLFVFWQYRCVRCYLFRSGKSIKAFNHEGHEGHEEHQKELFFSLVLFVFFVVPFFSGSFATGDDGWLAISIARPLTVADDSLMFTLRSLP